jgi:hypothetical protein
MAMHAQLSPYYPRRARWYSPLWGLWYRTKRWLYLDRFPRIAQHEVLQLLLGIVLPGWALFWSRRPILGVILGTAYCSAAAVFLIWVGHPVSNTALTVMISIHAGTLLRVAPSAGLWKRILHSLLSFLAMTCLVYLPLRHEMEKHWLMPLLVRDRVIVVRTGVDPHKIHRGDWVAYQIGRGKMTPVFEAGVYIHSGTMLGRVLAVVGDEVRFQQDGVLIQGRFEPRSRYMPSSGDFRVPEGCWFIWPDFDINGHGLVATETISAAMLQLANVPQQTLIGTPYERWFGRPQTLP